MINMMRIRLTAGKSIRLGAVATVITAILLGSAGIVGAAAPEKVIRQIGVMEKIIDKVLVDSPNFLVQRGDNARGLYIDGFGVVFTFDASLVNEWYGMEKLLSLGDRFEMKTDENGNQIFMIKKDAKSEKESKEKSDQAEKSPEEKMKDRAKLYQDGKAELVQALLDYGETMTSLTNDSSIILAAFLKDDDYFREQKISRLLLQAKVGDLRAFASGEISADVMKSRVAIEDY